MTRFSRRPIFLPAVVLVLALVAAACSGDDDGDGGRSGGGRAGEGEEAAPTYAFSVTALEVAPMAAQAPPFPDDVRQAVVGTLDHYLRAAVVDPMLNGTAPTGLEHAFTGAALGRVTAPGPERAAVLEEGTPVAGKVHQDRARAALTALTGRSGEIVLVTAQVDIGHTVDVGDTAVDVVRAGELVLIPDVAGWRIDAFDMRTVRDSR